MPRNLGPAANTSGWGAGGGGSFDGGPIGGVLWWSRKTNPSTEYALANGQTLSKFDFPDGYQCAVEEVALGNTLWSHTSTTFTVPDLRNKFLLAAGAGNLLGATGGAETVALTVPEMPAHNAYNAAGGGFAHAGGSGPVGGIQGSGVAHNNMPPYLSLAAFVKVAGVSIDSGAIVGPSGADGQDGAPGGTNGYHVEESSGSGYVTIPDLGAAGDWLVSGSLTVTASGAYYVDVELELTADATLWSGRLSVSDLGSYLPLVIPFPQRVVTLPASVPLQLAVTSITGGYVLETSLTALAFEDLA